MSTIKRKKRDKPFTIIDNGVIQNGALTPASMGIYAHIMSLPDDWVITVAYLENFFKNVGRDYIKTALNGLEKAGYLERIRTRESGRFKVNYILYEVPHRNGKTVTVKSTTTTEKPQRKTRHGVTLYKNGISKDIPKNKERECENSTLKTPSLQDVLDASKTLGLDEKISLKFFHYWEIKGWTSDLINRLSDALKLWHLREFKNPVQQDASNEPYPDWIDIYWDDLDKMEG